MSIARGPTPIYNTPDIPHLQPVLAVDHQGLIKSIEHIALPGTKFQVLKEVSPNIYEVSTADYPSSTPLYVDSRFLEKTPKEPLDRERNLPSVDSILEFMQSLLGFRYFWGGNWAQGIPEMLALYPHLKPSDDVICRGVDCSGLLYQATNGFTPRNTSELCTFGQEIDVDQDSLLSVQQIVKPLDMMVWKGHVIFVLDSGHFIESVLSQGVIISDFIERYTYFHDKLRKNSKTFSLRRWHPQ
jgi:cell wall-associated NlpC family hydrolase